MQDDQRTATEQRLTDARRAVQPWWQAGMVATVVQLLISVALLTITVAVAVDDDRQERLESSLTIAAELLIWGLAVAVVLMIGALVLTARRNGGGPVLLVVVSVVLATMAGSIGLAALGTGGTVGTVGGVDTVGGAWPAISIVVFVISVAATVIGAATLGRKLRVSRIEGAIGVRRY